MLDKTKKHDRFVRIKNKTTNIHAVKEKTLHEFDENCDGIMELSFFDNGRVEFRITENSPIETIAEVHRIEHKHKTISIIRFVTKP